MPDALYTDGQREAFGRRLNSGGLGETYLSIDGRYIAKVLFERNQTHLAQRRRSLEKVTTSFNPVRQHPYWSRLFAWPDKVIVRFGGAAKLGVRAPFSPLHDLSKSIDWTGHGYSDLKAEERGWWIARVAIALKLARAMHFLEQHTFVHTDLSPNNVFGDVYSGEMTVIDCDGIVSPGTTLEQTALGSPGYIAPELLLPGPLRKKRGLKYESTFNSDRHALAVLLYQLLLYRHPLEGPKRHPNPQPGKEQAENNWRLGEGATYIENPVDTSNRPKGFMISASTLGPTINNLFRRAFVDAIRLDQPVRPYASEWEDALTRLYDRIVPCSNPDCPQRFFAAPETPEPNIACSLCKQTLRGPSSIPYLRLLRFDRGKYSDDMNYVVVGWPGRVLHEWHLATHVKPVPDNGYVYDPRPVARFEYDQEQDVWCLRNLRMEKLLLTDKNAYVPITGTIPLEHDMAMWLSGDQTSRLAAVDMGSMQSGGPVFALPESMIENNAPWPTLQVTPEDKTWEPGDSITLSRYTYHYVEEDGDILPVIDVPPRLSGYIARVPFYGLVAGLLAGALSLYAMGSALGALVGAVVGVVVGIPITRAQWRRDNAQWHMENAIPGSA